MGLSLKELTQLLMQKVPFKNSWVKEAYGPHNTRLNTRGKVERALYCVTPTEGVVKQFKEGNYDILLTHHPYIVGVPQWIAHTALDCGEGGLNDQWRDLYGLKNPRHFDGKLGWYGEIEPTTLDELIKKAEDFVGAPLIGEHHGHEHPIRSMVICTGLGGMVEHLAAKTNADVYVLGEASSPKERSLFKARIETGHTLSEHPTGLNFFRKHLEPHGIIVDGADLKHDRYSGEVYQRPVYHPYFAEAGVGNYKGWGPRWKDVDWDKYALDTKDDRPQDYSEGKWGEPNSDTPPMGPADEEEADFWNTYWRKAGAGERPPTKVGGVPKLDTETSRGTGIQGVAEIESEPEPETVDSTAEEVSENDPFHVKVPKGG